MTEVFNKRSEKCKNPFVVHTSYDKMQLFPCDTVPLKLFPCFVEKIHCTVQCTQYTCTVLQQQIKWQLKYNDSKYIEDTVHTHSRNNSTWL